MSSYRGAWDGGPPGAEGEHPSPIPGAGPPAAALRTDPWTGASLAPLDYYPYGYHPHYDPRYYRPQEYYAPPPAPAPPPRRRASSGDRSPSRSPRRARRSPSRSPDRSPRRPRHRSPSASLSPRSPRPAARRRSPPRERRREPATPPRRRRSSTPPPARARRERSPTPRRKDRDRSLTPPRSYKFKSDTPPRRARDSSITPPRSYARGGSASSDGSDGSGSKSSAASSPPARRKKRSTSASSGDSGSSQSSRERSERKRRGSRSPRRSRSGSARRAAEARKKRSRSPSARSPGSGGGTPSDDEQRRGQFTVADRKRFWKIHNHRQERDPRTPPRELKPPPGAVEPTSIDDLEYGDPPDLEGPNYAELLPPPDLALSAQASSSRSKPGVPVIKNDGSFLEMFKKMQEATKKAEDAAKKPEIKKPVLPFIGKRRGGRVLKTGVVKKAKAIDEQTVDNTPKDAWSLYMQEVKKYRETSCEEERKTRPLVK